MIAAFVAARSELVGPFTGTGSHVVIPFDLRRHGTKPMGDTVSMCSGAIEVPLHYQPDQSVWANARKFQASVLKKVSKLDSTFLNLLYFDPNLLDAMSVFALPALTHPQQTGVTDNTYTEVIWGNLEEGQEVLTGEGEGNGDQSSRSRMRGPMMFIRR